MWRNLLPQGTRTVELCSGYALVLSALAILFNIVDPYPDIAQFDSLTTWGILFITLGSLQVYSIWAYPKVEVLRTVMSWVSGCLWVWIVMLSAKHGVSLEDIGTLLLGLGNFYGFIINFNLLYTTWTD